MTTEELIVAYNPTNARNLTPEQITALSTLTNEDLDVLAKRYPNDPNGKAYLVLFDKNVPEKKQLYPLSTWQNLRNLRKYAGAKNLVVFNFRELHNVTKKAPSVPALRSVHTAAPAKGQTVDLSAAEAAQRLRQHLKPVDKEPAAPVAAAKAGPARPTKPSAIPVTTKPVARGAKAGATKPAAAPDSQLPADQQTQSFE